MAKCTLLITTARKQHGLILETGLSLSSYSNIKIDTNLAHSLNDAETCCLERDASINKLVSHFLG